MSADTVSKSDSHDAHDMLARELKSDVDDGADDSARGQKRERDDAEADGNAPPPPKCERADSPVPLKEDVLDLGPNAYKRFGILYVLTKGIVASVTRNDDKVVTEVTMEVEDVERTGGPATEGAIRAAWRSFAFDWPTRTKAVFRGPAARALAVMVDAAHEVMHPGYSKIVLEKVVPKAVSNNFPNPHYATTSVGDGDGGGGFRSWYKREEEVHALLTALDSRVVEHKTAELAKMHTNRLNSLPVVDRRGGWKEHASYIRAARKPQEEGELDLANALLALYVYFVQLDSWSHDISGDKTEIHKEVLVLQREFREQFAKEYPSH